MKTILLSIFLTGVFYSLNSWAGASCKYDSNAEVIKSCPDGYNEEPVQASNTVVLPNGASATAPDTSGIKPVILCKCVPDSTRQSPKDIASTCSSLMQRYGSDAAALAKEAKNDRKESKNQINKLTDDLTEAQQKMAENRQKTEEKINELDKNKQEEDLQKQKDQQDKKVELAEQQRKQQEQIGLMDKQIQVANASMGSARIAYAAVVSANSPQEVRLKCMVELRKSLGQMGASSNSISGGSAAIGQQQNLIAAAWNSCIDRTQTEAQANIAQANERITSAQAEIDHLQKQKDLANQARESMSQAHLQNEQQAAQAASLANNQYQQQKMTLMRNMYENQQNDLNKMQSINKKIEEEKRSQSQISPLSGGGDKQLDADLKAFKVACCKGDALRPEFSNNPDQDYEDSDIASMCTQEVGAEGGLSTFMGPFSSLFGNMGSQAAGGSGFGGMGNGFNGVNPLGGLQ